MIFDLFGYRITVEQATDENIYDVVVNNKMSQSKRRKIINEVLSVKLEDADYLSNTKLTAIRKARKRYGLRLIEAKRFVESLFPYYESGTNEPVFKK